MKRQEFMDLSSKQQLAWIELNVDEYEVLLYNDGYIGCSYPSEESEIAEINLIFAKSSSSFDKRLLVI